MNSIDALKTLEITHGETIHYSIIWLHGLGADGHDFAPIIPELKLPTSLGIRFIFPHAPIRPVSINNGYEMRAWFDVYGLTKDTRIDKAGIEKAATSIEQLIEIEIARGTPSHRIVLAGFSQGAALSLVAGLNYQKPLAGIIALSGYLPPPHEAIDKASDANKGLPIFLAHGIHDNIVAFAFGEATDQVLQTAGYQVSWHAYSMGHSVCAEEVHDISQWLITHLK